MSCPDVAIKPFVRVAGIMRAPGVGGCTHLHLLDNAGGGCGRFSEGCEIQFLLPYYSRRCAHPVQGNVAQQPLAIMPAARRLPNALNVVEIARFSSRHWKLLWQGTRSASSKSMQEMSFQCEIVILKVCVDAHFRFGDYAHRSADAPFSSAGSLSFS